MPSDNRYQQTIINLILNINYFLINEVKNLEELVTVEYTSENLQLINAILKNGEYDQLKIVKPVDNLLGEDITVFRFTDENDDSYYTTVYDSIELYQNPTILDIFRAVTK